MLTPGDVVHLDLGTPAGSEAGLRRPAVVITAGQILRGGPNVIHVVPLTRSVRISSMEVTIEPDDRNGLAARSSAQCQHIRTVAMSRVDRQLGNIGPVTLAQIRNVLAIVLDI